MALRRIETEVSSDGNLPFLNKMGQDFDSLVSTNWFIREVISCDSGYLVLTTKFKAFIFRDSAMYTFLAEALNVWTDRNEPSYPLFAEVLRTKKITLAVDDEALTSNWTVSGLRYIQSQNPLEHDGQVEAVSNPLLPPTPVVRTRTSKKKQESSTPYPESMMH